MALKFFRFEQKNYGEKILKDIGILFDFLNKSDQKQLSDYLISPFFNINKQCVELYDHILPLHKRGTKKTNVEVLLLKWTKENEKTKYDISHLLKKARHLYQHILDFLAHQKIRDHEKDKLQVLQKQLRNKGVSKLFEEVSQKLYNLVSSEPIGLDRLFDEFQLCHLAYFENNMDHEQNGLAFFNVLNSKLIRFSGTFKAAYACEMSNLEKAASRKNNTQKIEFFCEREETINLQELYQLNLAIDQPNDDFSKSKLNDFSNALDSVETKINVIDRLILCKNIINRIAREINFGKINLMPDLFKWLKKRVEWVLYPTTQIGENEFLNVVNVALNCKKTEYAHDYLRNYNQYLPGGKDNKAYFLAHAYCLFYDESYKAVIKLLKKEFPKHSDAHFYFILRVKALLMQACLELILREGEAFDDFDLVKDDLRKYFERNESIIPNEMYDRYFNFHQIICDIKEAFYDAFITKKYSEMKKKLLKKVAETDPLKSCDWFENIIFKYF